MSVLIYRSVAAQQDATTAADRSSSPININESDQLLRNNCAAARGQSFSAAAEHAVELQDRLAIDSKAPRNFEVHV